MRPSRNTSRSSPRRCRTSRIRRSAPAARWAAVSRTPTRPRSSAVMVALGATFELHSPRGRRSVAAEEFYTGLFTTALAPDELLVEIAIPRAGPRRGSAFAEVARRHGDYALAGVAAVVALDDAGRCREARIALLSVGDGPVLARKAAKA